MKTRLWKLLAVIVVFSLVGCATPRPEKIVETKVVEVEKEVTKIVAGTPVVEKVIVTATPEVVEKEAIDVMGFPRRETLFAQQLTGRSGTPDNFNEWVG